MALDENAANGAAPTLGRRLEARYRQIHTISMADLPICNAALRVAATGFREFGGRAFGVITTPWFMNLVALDLPGGAVAPPAAPGTTLRIGLPAGEIDFIVGELETIGRVDSCSLFSPVFEFDTMDAALAAAEAVVRSVFDPALLEPARPAPEPVNRRELLRGRVRKSDAGAAP